MSVTSTDVTHPKSNGRSATARLSSESLEDRQSLNAVVDRITKFISPVPYVPSIPQDKPDFYHNSFSSPRAWYYDTPFNEHEHPNLQYMTFLYQDPTESCIQLHNMDEYDPAKSKPQVSKINGIQSTITASSRGSAPKKKMTFGDYKKKQSNGGAFTSTQQRAGENQHDGMDAKKENKDSSGPAKKSHDNFHESLEPKLEKPSARVEAHQDSPPPAKKRRLSPPPLKIAKDHELTQLAAPIDDPLNLPSSPVSMDIPSIPVSLDLPSFIKNELSAHEKQKYTPDGSPAPSKVLPSAQPEKLPSNKRIDSPLPGPANGLHNRLPPITDNEKDASLNVYKNSHAHPTKVADHSLHEDRAHAIPNKAKSTNTIHDSVHDKADAKMAKNDASPAGSLKHPTDSQHIPNPQKSKVAPDVRENRPRMRKIIKLKIRTKSARKNLADYLRLPPKPWPSSKFDLFLGREPEKSKDARTSNATNTNGTRASADRSAVPESTARTAEKRLRPNEESIVQERANKRLKVPLAQDGPNDSATPVGSRSKSPTSNPSSAQKQIQSTPRKDLKSVAMQRIGSTESVHTPHGSIQTPPASGNYEHMTPKKDPSVESERQAWKAENSRLSKMGANLKHSAENKDGKGEKNPKLAAVKMLESFLCFLLAFVCNDNLQRISNLPPVLKDNTWPSLQKFSIMAKERVKPYPHLYGLAQQLVVVLHSHIATLAVRIPATQWPSPLMLQDTMTQLHQSTASGAHRLPIQELTERYPRTCKKAVDHITQIEFGKPKEYNGEYTVPLTVQSTPLQAVRFGVVFLKEWLQQEKLVYDLELKL